MADQSHAHEALENAVWQLLLDCSGSVMAAIRRFNIRARDIQLKFSLQNVLELTAFIAIFLALASIPYSGPAICILFAHIGAIGSPVLLGFRAILTGKANGTQLETTTPALDGIFLRFAAFSGLIVAIFWLGIICGWGYNLLTWTISRI